MHGFKFVIQFSPSYHYAGVQLNWIKAHFVSRLKVFPVWVGYISDWGEKSCAQIYLQRSTWELIYQY